MARLSRGFLGGFIGKLGTSYGSYWRLLELIKAMPRKSGKPPTPAQLDVQIRLAMVVIILSKIATYVKEGFIARVKPGQSPMNLAVSYNLKNAITGVAPNYVIDYPELRYSEGNLDGVEEQQVVTAVDCILNVSWAMGYLDTGKATDLVKVLVYVPNKEKFVKVDAVLRSALECEVQMPLSFVGEVAHCYLCVSSADGKRVATSQYIAQVTLI